MEEIQEFAGGMGNATTQICVIDPDGRGLMVVSNPKLNAGYPGWSNDLKTLYFADDRGTILVDADGSNMRKRKKGELPTPGESPDGKWSVFALSNGIGFSITSIDPGVVPAVTKKVVTTRESCCLIARWSPDSKFLVYTEYESRAQDCLQLWKVDIDTRERTKLTGIGTPSESFGICVYPDSGRWSPDGTAILYTAELKEPDVQRPYLVAPDGSNPRALLTDSAFDDPEWFAGAVAWSPDGRALILNVVTMTGGGTYIVSADGTEKLKFAADSMALRVVADFAWAPGL